MEPEKVDKALSYAATKIGVPSLVPTDDRKVCLDDPHE